MASMLAAAAVLAAAGAAAAWALWVLVLTARAVREQQARERSLRLLALLAPGVTAAADDPRALLSWQPLAAAARRMFPDECRALDEAFGATFPFSTEQIQAAHARWTAEWLAWERAHDSEYKLKAADLEATLQATGASSLQRARVEAVEREKLERYQRRYEEYVRVGKALQSLLGP